jgi:hypothetical protein
MISILELTVLAAVGVGGIAALVGSAEVLARRWVRRRVRHAVYQPHSHVIHRIDRATLPELTEQIELRVNADGERGEPLEEYRNPFRILVAGGSSAECYLLDQTDQWPAVLERMLRTPAALRALSVADVYVGSVARSGFDSEDVHRILRRVLDPRKHHMLLLFVGASNILRWIYVGAPADREVDALPSGELFSVDPQRAFSLHPKRTALAFLAYQAFVRVRRPVIRRENGGRYLARLRKLRANASQMIEEAPDARRTLDRFARGLRASIDVARRAGVRVLVVTQPYLYRPDLSPEAQAREWFGALDDAFKKDVDRYLTPAVVCELMRQVADRTLDVCDEAGVQCVDLFRLLPLDETYFYDGAHFTPRGALAVADILAQAILTGEDDAAEATSMASSDTLG